MKQRAQPIFQLGAGSPWLLVSIIVLSLILAFVVAGSLVKIPPININTPPSAESK